MYSFLDLERRPEDLIDFRIFGLYTFVVCFKYGATERLSNEAHVHNEFKSNSTSFDILSKTIDDKKNKNKKGC